MTRNRVLGFVVLAAVVCALTGSYSREAFAAPAKPFTWFKYTAKDGKEYDHPKWTDAGGGKRTMVAGASGWLTFTETPPVTKVIFKVHRHAPQGGWNAVPAISKLMDPASTYSGFPINAWLLQGSDNNIPKIEFDEGEEIKVVWVVTTTENNVDTVSLVESIFTVQYHE